MDVVNSFSANYWTLARKVVSIMKNAMKEFRIFHSFTQKEAAECLGFSGSRTIRRMEGGTQEISGPALKAMQYYTELTAKRLVIEHLNGDQK